MPQKIYLCVNFARCDFRMSCVRNLHRCKFRTLCISHDTGNTTTLKNVATLDALFSAFNISSSSLILSFLPSPFPPFPSSFPSFPSTFLRFCLQQFLLFLHPFIFSLHPFLLSLHSFILFNFHMLTF